jgi:hypothetical protein
MYFYSGSSFLWDFTKRSNYSSFLNGSFWRGLILIVIVGIIFIAGAVFAILSGNGGDYGRRY